MRTLQEKDVFLEWIRYTPVRLCLGDKFKAFCLNKWFSSSKFEILSSKLEKSVQII